MPRCGALASQRIAVDHLAANLQLQASRYSVVEMAVQCSDQLMQKIQAQNRRTLDLLASKCYFYHSRCYELVDRMSDIRSFLHSRLRTATLRSDYEGQAVLVNCLLRNYLHYNLYEQRVIFRSVERVGNASGSSICCMKRVIQPEQTRKAFVAIPSLQETVHACVCIMSNDTA
ncbi:hypothetical protein HPB51_005000 [Rhipicephalus microplus]|uniref:26S proteasome non-ATPase regulatory subunit 3 N-terminal TPR repeats domain-containing protein n=1 Tax=Rhipicephalus microplus TaxID=6941 RepID=A0A9J6DL77_RHIMP|nr:hypothetical protein HPB51_005000 [Rhipicephalus microplus]